MDELQDMIGRARGGDRAAFGQLVRRLSRAALGYALARVGDWHRAEDVAQDAFVELYAYLPRLREPRALVGVLRRMVRKHADRVTRGAGHARPPPPLPAGEVAIPSVDPADAAAAGERARTVRWAVQSLPLHDREALVLFHLSGRSQVEVARLLGVSVAAIKVRLHRARTKLKVRLTHMVENELESSHRGESLAARVEKALALFGSKGPADGSTEPEWSRRLKEQTGEILKAGPDGIAVDRVMAQAPQMRVRRWAALHFGFRGDADSLRELERLLGDPSKHVRRTALLAYAVAIHPDDTATLSNIGPPASRAPAELAYLLPLTRDVDVKTRMDALTAVDAYRAVDGRAEAAVRAGLDDPIHKVHHAAARLLRVACPGCGALPGDDNARRGNE